MTLLEYITSLQDTGLSQEEIFAKAQEFKGKTKPEKVEVTETPVEQAKGKDVADQADATVTSTPNASNTMFSDSVSIFGDGKSQYQEGDFADTFKNAFGTSIEDSKKRDKKLADYNAQMAKLNTVTTEGETHTADSFDYKWEPKDDGGINYYQKKEGKEEWQLEDDDFAIYSIAGELGHLSKEEEKKLQDFKNQQGEEVDPFAWAKNAEGGTRDLFDTSGVDALGELPGLSKLSGFEMIIEDPKTDREILDNQISSSDKSLTKAEKAVIKTEAAYNESLTPEVKERIEEQAYLLGNYEVEKANLEKKLASIPMGSKDHEVIEKELSELDRTFSIANKAYLSTSQPFIDKTLEEQMPDIEQRAFEAAIISEVEEPTLWNLAGKVFQNTKGPSGFGNVVSKITGDIFNPEDKNLIRQQDLYAAEKAKYAKKNNVSLEDVTNEMVRPAVEAAYVDIFSLKARKDAYENYSDSLLSDPDVPIFDLFKKLTGFKSLTDVFGDTEQEINADVAARGFSFDTAKTNLVYEQAKNEILKIDSQLLALTETKFISEDSAVEARGQFEKLVKQRQQNIDIANDTLNSLGEKVKTSKDVGLYSNMIAKNYGAGSGLGGFIISATASLVAGGIEGAERYGLTRLINPLSRLPMTNEMREAYFGEGGLFDSRKLTNIQISMLDAVQESIEGEMAEAKDWDNSEGLMQKSRWMARTAGQQIPIYALLYGTGGAGLGFIGLSTAGSKFREMQNEIDFNGADYTKWQMYTAATMTGASAVASEYVTQGMLGRLGVSFKADKIFANGFKETMGNLVKGTGRWLVDQSEEVGSEVADNIVGNIVDKYVLQKKGVNIFDNVKETAFSTLFTSGIVMRLPTIGASITAPFRSKESFQVIGENTRTIKELSKQLDSGTLSSEGRKLIETQIQKLVVENVSALKTDLLRIDNMSDADKKVLIDSKAAEYENLRAIEDVNNDRTLDRSTRESLVKDLQKQVYENANKRNEILGGYILEENKEKVDELKEGAGVAISQLGAGVERVDNTEDFMSVALSLEAQGVQANINKNEAGEVLPAKEQDYGIFAKVPDGKGGFDIQVIINDASSEADGLLPADKHELLHIAAMKMDDASKVKMGGDILNSLLNDSNIEIDAKIERLLRAYRLDLDKGDITVAEFFEEVMAVTSDGLTPDLKTGVAAIRVKDVSKFKAIGQKILQAIGWRQNFADGQQAIDFLKDFNADVLKGEGLSEGVLSRFDTKTDTEVDMGLETEVDLGDVKASKKDTGAIASTKVQEIYDTQGEAGAFDIIDQFKPIVSRIVEKRRDAPNFDRQLLTDEIETGKRGIFDLIREYKPESGVPLAAYINKFLPARAIEASQRVLSEEFTSDVTEAKGVMAEEVTTEVAAKPVTRKIKPSSFISNEAVAKIKEQVQEKIKGIDPKNLTFKKLGDLAPEIIAQELGIPVKKLTSPTANLSKGDATAIQQFVNKNADKLLKILPEGAVVEAATDKLLGTSTGVPKGLLNAFYTKQARLGKGAGLAPFKLNKGISKADFLETFGIVEGKKAEGFDARSPQAQALKGIASLYGKLVTNEIVRSDTGLSLEAKQDVAAGKNKAMASKRDAGSQYNVDSNVVNAGYKPIKPGVEGVTDLSNFLVDDLTKVFGKNASLFAVASNLASAGNSYIGSKPTSGAKGRKFLFISDANKTKRYIKETKEALESGELGDLKVINNTISALEGLDAISESDLKAIKQAISSQTIKNIEGNLKNKSLHDKGVRLIIEKFAELYKLDPKNIRGIASIIYNQNANYSFGRKMAAVLGLEQGIEPGSKSWEEHVYQFGNFANRTLEAISSDNPKVLDGWIKWVNDNYYQEVTGKETQAIVDATYFKDGITWKAKSEEHPYLNEKLNEAFKTGDFSEVPPADIRKYNEYFALNPNNRSIDGVSDAAKYNVEVDAKFRNNLDVQAEQQKLIYEQFIGETTAEKAKQDIKVYTELATGKSMASKRDSDLIPDAIKYDKPITVQTAINALEKTDKALELARKLDQPVKKIRVFDFDDTLARTKSNVLYTMPDGTTGAIDAATFAKEAGNMEAEGAQWDFSEFSKVMQGSKGPLLDVAKIIADKRGTKDVFVLTARPANAAGPIKEFLASMGLDIPLANITGLGDGAPQAKAGWIMGKAAEGYNDFYFADDHTGNVKAVKDVLSQIDVKSKVQLAKASKRQTFDTVVNDMIEDSSGIETYKKYSAARAQTVGASKGKYNFLIPPSAEDFTGLLYKMLGKGKKGDAQMAFLKTNLLDPYNRAESAVTQAKVSAANDFVALKNKLKTLPKTLSKQTGIGKFTYSHAVRVAAWTKQGMDIPGLSKRDVKELVDFVNNDAKLRVFTDELINIQKGKEYPKPGKTWLGGNITTDIIGGINKVNRAEYQQEWRENLDIIFSEDNMNKMEAAYGTRWREAMEDSIRRMKSGSNRPIGGNRVTEGLLNWLNNSVGAVMFLNTRSALLQTISAVNFINLSDNNIVKAGVAFANQKQFWGDFMTLMNSDYLVERRNGLKINVSESEIADAVREAQNKPKAAIAFLLSKGFVMTRFADSFAIASGGSTFYRNRVNKYVKEGIEQSVAEKQAFEDFKAIAETSQQSSSPSKISQQQASAAGRVILAWANTPMQYARIQKRAAQDLINGRGDWKTNISKIAYYGAVQNLIFNTLQNAVFALGFGDDDEEDEVKAKKKEEKAYKVANGMIDSQLKGLGIFGAASVAMKNTLMTLYKEHNKKGSKYENAVADLEGFSPPLGSKIGKITGGLRSFSWNKKDIKEKGFSLDNPAYIAGAQVVTGLTNVPLDRVMKKINNIRGIVNERSALWQKVALGLGWSTWDVDLGYYGGFDKEKPLTPKQQLKLEVDTMKKDTNKPDQVKTLLDFGLTKKQIRELKNENNRVKKILELQKNKK